MNEKKKPGIPKVVKILCISASIMTAVYFLLSLVFICSPDAAVSIMGADKKILDEYVISTGQLLTYIGMYAVCLFLPVVAVMTVVNNGKNGYKGARTRIILTLVLVLLATIITRVLSGSLIPALASSGSAGMAVVSITNSLIAKISFIYLAARTMIFSALSIEAYDQYMKENG